MRPRGPLSRRRQPPETIRCNTVPYGNWEASPDTPECAGLGPPAFFLGIGPLYQASWSFSWHSTTQRRHISAFLLFHGQDDPQYSGPSGYLWVHVNSYGKFGWPCQEVSFLHDIPSQRLFATPRRHMSALRLFCGQDGSHCSGPSGCPCVHAITYGKFRWPGQQVCFHHDKLSRRYFVIARSAPRQVCSTVRNGRVQSMLALSRSAYASAKKPQPWCCIRSIHLRGVGL